MKPGVSLSSAKTLELYLRHISLLNVSFSFPFSFVFTSPRPFFPLYFLFQRDDSIYIIMV